MVLPMKGWSVALWMYAWASLALCCSSIFVPFERDQPPSYCTVYHHLVKSGGTSLKDQLQRQSVVSGLPKPGLCTSDGRTTGQMCLNALHNSTIIMGYGEELRNALAEQGRDCEFFTMMRDPIDRVVSAFFYCPKDHDVQQNRPAQWCGNYEGEGAPPITERLLTFTAHMFSNTAYQTLYRSMLCDPGFVLCAPEHARRRDQRPNQLGSQESWELLEGVKEILTTYNAVGIFEFWDLSMQLFNTRIKSPVANWDAGIAKNPGVRTGVREEVTQWARNSTELHDLLSADMHIYEFALSIFKRQTAESLGTIWR